MTDSVIKVNDYFSCAMDNLIIAMVAQDRDNTMLKIRRRLRDASNPFEIPKSEFRSLYRLSKEAVFMLIENLRPLLPIARRRHAVSVELQQLVPIRKELVKTI